MKIHLVWTSYGIFTFTKIAYAVYVFHAQNWLSFSGIFGYRSSIYIILAKSVLWRIWAPDYTRSCSGWQLECREKWTKIYTVKYWFLRRILAQKWTSSSTFGHAERPLEVARSAVGPRHRLGTLRRDVEKCLKTPCVWGIRKNFKNNVFLRIPSLMVPDWYH